MNYLNSFLWANLTAPLRKGPDASKKLVICLVVKREQVGMDNRQWEWNVFCEILSRWRQGPGTVPVAEPQVDSKMVGERGRVLTVLTGRKKGKHHTGI